MFMIKLLFVKKTAQLLKPSPKKKIDATKIAGSYAQRP